MADLLAAAINLRNTTPLGDHRLFAIRNDHVAFLRRLSNGVI